MPRLPPRRPTSEVQEAFQFLLAIAMHEGRNPRFGKFDLLIRIAFNLDIPSHLM